MPSRVVASGERKPSRSSAVKRASASASGAPAGRFALRAAFSACVELLAGARGRAVGARPCRRAAAARRCGIDRGGAGTGLSGQSPAQRAAHHRAPDRRGRFAGAVGLSSDALRQRRGRRAIHQPHRGFSATPAGGAERLPVLGQGLQHAALHRSQRPANAVQRRTDRQPRPRRREPGFRLAGNAADDGTIGAFVGRDGLHGRVARRREPVGAAEQYARPRAHSARHAQSLPGRASDVDGRSPSRGATRRRRSRAFTRRNRR